MMEIMILLTDVLIVDIKVKSNGLIVYMVTALLKKQNHYQRLRKCRQIVEYKMKFLECEVRQDSNTCNDKIENMNQFLSYYDYLQCVKGICYLLLEGNYLFNNGCIIDKINQIICMIEKSFCGDGIIQVFVQSDGTNSLLFDICFDCKHSRVINCYSENVKFATESSYYQLGTPRNTFYFALQKCENVVQVPNQTCQETNTSCVSSNLYKPQCIFRGFFLQYANQHKVFLQLVKDDIFWMDNQVKQQQIAKKLYFQRMLVIGWTQSAIFQHAMILVCWILFSSQNFLKQIQISPLIEFNCAFLIIKKNRFNENYFQIFKILIIFIKNLMQLNLILNLVQHIKQQITKS